MGLFKDFKEDFTQAVNELVPGGEVENEDVVVDTLSEDVDVKSELSKLDGLLEQVKEEPVAAPVVEKPVAKEEKLVMDMPVRETVEILDETSVITSSTVLTGNLASAGSFDIQGTVNGNVTCNGKLVVTGVINGNSTSSEFFADVAKIEGEVVSTGTVKIGAGSVILKGSVIEDDCIIAAGSIVKGHIPAGSIYVQKREKTVLSL